MIGKEVVGTDRRGLLIAALVGTLLSLAFTGQVAGFRNNLFHLPILAGLSHLPQFANDPFIRTMPYYASGFWQALDGVAPGRSGLILLDLLAVLSRFAAIVAFLLCADLAGIRQRGERLLFVVLIAFSSILNGYSSAGSHGLFINSFTHSELANATMLLTLWCAGRGRFFGAFAWNGVTFFLNAFMAVWMAAPLALIAILLLRRGETDARTMARRMGSGFVAFLLIASPAIVNFLGNPEFARPMDHDYPAYLREYFSEHFLIDGSSLRSIFMLSLTAATGFAAAFRLAQADRRTAFILAALAGFVVDWIGGAIVPLVFPAPMFINLQFLRGGGGIFLMAGLALAVLTVVVSREGQGRRIWAPVLAIGGDTVRQALPILLIAAGAMRLRLPARLRLDWVAILALPLVWGMSIIGNARENAVERANIAAWVTIGDWARTHTAPHDRFLIPIQNILYKDPPFQPVRPDQAALAQGYEVFSSIAERSTFVDIRSGAAGLWTPSFYLPWRRRVMAVMALNDHRERMTFAAAHGLAYVVDRCGGEGALFGADGRCVYRAIQVAKP